SSASGRVGMAQLGTAGGGRPTALGSALHETGPGGRFEPRDNVVELVEVAVGKDELAALALLAHGDPEPGTLGQPPLQVADVGIGLGGVLRPAPAAAALHAAALGDQLLGLAHREPSLDHGGG